MSSRAVLPFLSAGLLLPILGAPVSLAESKEDVRFEGSGPAENAKRLLASAVAIRYDCDTRARIDLRMRDGRGGERHRRLQTVSKHIRGRMHSIGRLTAPPHLRGMTVLSIEARDRSDDVFVYLPSLRRVRRISTSRRTDSFLGSDLTYEDLDRQRADDYLVDSLAREMLEGEPVHVITARPRVHESYHRVAFLVATSDLAILGMRYYKAGDARPFRVVSFPRGSILKRGENLIPTRIHVANTIRGTETDVEVVELEVNPEIDDRLFSIVTLRAQRGLGTLRDVRERTRPNAP
jgi:hypothetical protein